MANKKDIDVLRVGVAMLDGGWTRSDAASHSPAPTQRVGNALATHGLEECLRKLGRDDEADLLHHHLTVALATADVPIECLVSAGFERQSGSSSSCSNGTNRVNGNHDTNGSCGSHGSSAIAVPQNNWLCLQPIPGSRITIKQSEV